VFVFEHTGYATETLMNGNISHCIEYLKHLNWCGATIKIHQELELIKEHCPERYDFILKKFDNGKDSNLNGYK
jgi:hypothetical protein